MRREQTRRHMETATCRGLQDMRDIGARPLPYRLIRTGKVHLARASVRVHVAPLSAALLVVLILSLALNC